MNVNILIACWSAVWSCSILAMSVLKHRPKVGSLISALLFFGKDAPGPGWQFILWVPLYVFFIWVIGCAFIILIAILFNRQFDVTNKKPLPAFMQDFLDKHKR